MLWIVLLVAYLVWFFALAVPMIWKEAKEGEVVEFYDVFARQCRQVWKLLTLPLAVVKRRRERKPA